MFRKIGSKVSGAEPVCYRESSQNATVVSVMWALDVWRALERVVVFDKLGDYRLEH
jgi:hypothetical protein